MKNLLPIGSVVLLKDATKKLVIIGILQVNPSENKIYDYLGVPYPEGYVSSDMKTLSVKLLLKPWISYTIKKNKY